METKTFNKLLNEVGEKEVIVSLDVNKVYKKFKEYYYDISHDKYYYAKKKLDENVELKKSLRQEMDTLNRLRNFPALNQEQKDEVARINSILENKDNKPDNAKEILNEIKEIEEKLHNLKLKIIELN